MPLFSPERALCLLIDLFISPTGLSPPMVGSFFFFSPHLRTFFHCFLEREEGTERNIDVTEKHRLVALCMCLYWGSYVPGLGIVHVQTEDQIHNPGYMP